MHLASYLRSAEEILRLYNGDIPFAAWLKAYFREHKKFGSKDRRMVGNLCFCYFRLGSAFIHLSIEEQLLVGQFLCHGLNVFVSHLKPEWSQQSLLPVADKLRFLQSNEFALFFPLLNEVSGEIEKEAFNLSHLIQPDLFLRIRPGKGDAVQQKLRQASIPFLVEGDCIRLDNASKVDELITVDEDAVVQDKSSQQVLNLLKEYWQKTSFSAWDCCAASGGKSILLHDLFPKATLTVSDIRESILHNLRSRFRRAGITSYRSFVADVSSPGFHRLEKFDVIISDAPCSGSGTWGRTPEQLRFFPRDKIAYYAKLQKDIAVNTSRCLKEGGAFLYITCSVLEKENEDVAMYIQQHTSLRLVEQRYFKGFAEKADTLFAALFTL